MLESRVWTSTPCPEHEIPQEPGFEHIKYARGYLVTRAPHAVPVAHWRTRKVGAWHVSWDSRLALHHASGENREVVVIGHPIALRCGQSDERVVESLLSSWEVSRERLDDELEWLAGRYVIIGLSSVGGFVQSDASGLLSAYYSPSDRAVGSHQNLVAEHMAQAQLSEFSSPEWLRATRAFTYPGTRTRWIGLSLLTANTELTLPDFQVRRVGPRPVEPRTAREAAELALDLMRVQLPHLYRGTRGPMVSLTAGLDSRITLAALRDVVEDSVFFTYQVGYGNNTAASRSDVATARELADRFRLDHQTFFIRESLPAGRMKFVLTQNSPLTHNRALARLYRRVLPMDRLHVRSNLYEIARGYYYQIERPAPDTALFTHLLTHGKSADAAVIRAFDEFADVTGILDVEGYDALDLFYWEIRMSSWLNRIMLESDIAHDTHVLVNSRAILQGLLSVPLADRVRARAFDHMVDLAWPELYQVPVNGQSRQLPV